MIFYTNRFVPSNSAGCSRGPVIFIRPEYKDDIGLLEHEKVHVKQWYRTFGVHSFLYLFSKNYKLKSEVEAYKKQLEYSPKSVDLFAKYLSEDYGLNISIDKVKTLL